MRIGITLPTFSEDAQNVLDAARTAESAGLHGVFSFDHMFPMDQPERPALSVYPTLAAVAAVTTRLRVGTLVARIGLVPDAVVVASLRSIQAISGGRVLAGVGTGDRKSSDEHRRYGLPELGPTARYGSLAAVTKQLGQAGIECWVGAGSKATNELARSEGVTLNLWGAEPEQVATAATVGPVSWAGPLPKQAGEAAALLRRLESSGATWAVWGWPSSIELVVEAADGAGIQLG